MATTTSKLALIKPATSENYDVGVLNTNADLIDNFATTIDNQKANKTQEAWITPTFENGSSGTIQYRKNDFGRIEFRGRLVVGAVNVPSFTLPTGYRPNSNINIQLISTGGVARIGAIFTSGVFQMSNGLSETMNMATFTFTTD